MTRPVTSWRPPDPLPIDEYVEAVRAQRREGDRALRVERP